MRKTQGLSLPPEDWEKLEEEAKKQNRSRNNLIETILQQYLREAEASNAGKQLDEE